MDFNGEKAKSIRTNESSLGILKMDGLKGRGRFFGDLTHDSSDNKTSASSYSSNRRISDRLNMERKKALEALEKSKSPIPLDRTEYVPFRRPNTINISDLVTDETINLETTPSSCTPSAGKDIKISFEPSEITGRSTLYKKDIKSCRNGGGATTSRAAGSTQSMSVNDILASSFAQKARNLCDTLSGGDMSFNTSSDNGQGGGKMLSTSIASSAFTNYNDSKSLPRTADMSLSKASYSELTFNGGDGVVNFSLNTDAGVSSHECSVSNEQFAPGEQMQSKLIMDEISWAEEYAAIPMATLSQEARAKATEGKPQAATNAFDMSSTSNSMIAGDPNFSLGNFFHMRSENIANIVKTTSPVKCRIPFALVDTEDFSSATANSSSFQIESTAASLQNTPILDNRTYTRTPIQLTNESQERKDSDSSYLLSMSAIDKALNSLERESCNTSNYKSDQLLMLTKKSQSCLNPTLSNAHAMPSHLRHKGTTSLGANMRLPETNKSNLQAIAEIILENKENLDPQIVMGGSQSKSDLSDTLSFSESLMNASDMKQMHNNSSAQRSPLSPIEVLRGEAPEIIVTKDSGGEEADSEQWPGTPPQNRRTKRSKSPNHYTTPSNVNGLTDDSSDATTPVNSRPSQSYIAEKKLMKSNIKEAKSLCSTRLDGERNDCVFISPNLSVNKNSSYLGRNNTLINSSPSSPHVDNSPHSTTSRSYHLTQPSSPTPTNLDTTSNSERQLLSAGDVHKVVSSPVNSEASGASSHATMHSARSTATTGTMRSISRCSSTSEFSHGDGKPIPLKVTATELSWGSVKLRSDSRKSMQIKNINSKRLVVRVEVSGPGFQIINSQRGNTVTLHSQECRTINISFCPTVPGVAIGKLSFFAPTGATTFSQPFMDLPLYGYGGSANVIPQKITIGPVGSPFVTMGDICELPQPMQRTIRFYNKGPLLAFAMITVDSLGLMLPRISDAFEIIPPKILIPPRHFADVQIVFRPKREDIKKIFKKIESVLSLANLRVICGDEVNRQRIRRLLLQMNKTERSKLSSSSLDMLWTHFPGEEEIKELAVIRESPSIAMELTTGLRVYEILLTINRENLDETGETSSLFLPDGDETLLFRTVICAADSNSPTPPTTSLGTVCESYGENDDQCYSSTASDKRQTSWSVRPSFVEMHLQRPSERVSLFVHNGYKSRQYFEVACSKRNLLRFSPSEGYVAPDNGQSEIIIELNENAFNNVHDDIFIIVNMENERIMVPVKIK